MQQGQAQIVVTADVSTAIKNLQLINKQMSEIIAESKKLDRALKDVGGKNVFSDTIKSTKTLREEILNTKSKVGTLGTELKNVNKNSSIPQTTKDLRATRNEVEMITRRMQNLSKIKLNTIMTGFNSSVKTANSETDKLEQTLFNIYAGSYMDHVWTKFVADAEQARNSVSEVEGKLKQMGDADVGSVFNTFNIEAISADKRVTKINNDLREVKSVDLGSTLDTFIADLKEADSKADELDSSLKQVSKEQVGDVTQELNAGVDRTQAALDGLTNEMDMLRKMANIEDKTVDLRTGAEKTKSEVNELEDSMKSISKIELGNPFSKMNAGANKATGSLKNHAANLLGLQELYSDFSNVLGNSISEYSKLNGVVREMTYQFTGLEDPMAATSMSLDDIRVKMSDGTAEGDKLNRMFNELQTYAGLTSFTLLDTAEGMLELAKSGYDAETALGILEPSMIAADMNGQNLQDTVHDVSGTILSFGTDLKTVDNPAQVFNKTLSQMQLAADITQSDLSDLTKGMQYMAPVASNVGWSMEDAVVAVAALGDSGLEASKGARVLASGLLRLANPTEKAAQSMDELGFSFYDANGNAKGLIEVFEGLQTATADLTDEERAYHMETIFGKSAIKSWGSLLNQNYDVIVANMKAVEGAGDGLGYLNYKFAETKSGIPTEQLDMMNESLMNATTESGKAAVAQANYNYFLREMVKNNPADYIELMNEKLSSFVFIVGEQATADLANFIYNGIQPATELFAAFAEETTGSSEDLQTFAADIVATTLEIGTLVGGLALAIEALALLSGALAVSGLVIAFGVALKETGVTAQELGTALGELANAVIALGQFAMNEVLVPILGTVIDSMVYLKDTIGSELKPMFEELGNTISTLLVPEIQNIITNFTELLEVILPPLMDTFNAFMEEVVVPLAGRFNELVDAVTPIIEDKLPALTDVVQNYLFPALEDLGETLADLTEAVLPPLIDALGIAILAFSGIVEVLAWVIEGAAQVVEQFPLATEVLFVGAVAAYAVYKAIKVWETLSGTFKAIRTAFKLTGDDGVTMGKRLGTVSYGTMIGFGIMATGIGVVLSEVRESMFKTSEAGAQMLQSNLEAVGGYLTNIDHVSDLTTQQLDYLTERYDLSEKQIAAIIFALNGETQTLSNGTQIGAERSNQILNNLAVEYGKTQGSVQLVVDSINSTAGMMSLGLADAKLKTDKLLESVRYNYDWTDEQVAAAVSSLNDTTLHSTDGLESASGDAEKLLNYIVNSYDVTKNDIAIIISALNGETPKMADGTEAASADIEKALADISKEYDISNGDLKAYVEEFVTRHEDISKSADKSSKDVTKAEGEKSKATKKSSDEMSKANDDTADSMSDLRAVVGDETVGVTASYGDMSDSSIISLSELQAENAATGDSMGDLSADAANAAASIQSSMSRIQSSASQASQAVNSVPQSGVMGPVTGATQSSAFQASRYLGSTPTRAFGGEQMYSNKGFNVMATGNTGTYGNTSVDSHDVFHIHGIRDTSERDKVISNIMDRKRRK